MLGHFAVRWRIQGRGPGEPGSPLIFKPNLGPKGGKKFFFETTPPVISGSGWPFPPAPHLIWRSGSVIAVFLRMPSQCWYTEFGELTAINKIGRTRRWARSWKTASGGSVPTIFAGDCGSSYDSKLWQRKVKLLRRWVLLLNENEWHNSTETANHDINWPMSTQLKNTISFSGRKTSYKYYYGRQENNDNIIFIQEWTVFLNLRMKNRV